MAIESEAVVAFTDVGLGEADGPLTTVTAGVDVAAAATGATATGVGFDLTFVVVEVSNAGWTPWE